MALSVDGKKLRELREANILTQPQLARKAGVTVETLSHLENERRDARNQTVLQIARALNVHPNEFLKGNTGPLALTRQTFPDEMKTLLTG